MAGGKGPQAPADNAQPDEEKGDAPRPKRSARNSDKKRKAPPDGQSGDEEEDEDEKALSEMQSRTFWALYHRDLLLAWLIDYNAPITKMRREDLIEMLVQGRAKYLQPREGDELEILRNVWRKQNEGSLEEPPGLHIAPPAAAAASAPTPSQAKPASKPPAKKAKVAGPEAPTSAQRDLNPQFVDEDMPDEGELAARVRTQLGEADRLAKASRAEQLRAEANAQQSRNCGLCGVAAPEGKDTSGTWNCDSCNLRGDTLPGAAEANKTLIMLRQATKASAEVSSASSSSGAAAATPTGAFDQQLRGLDKYFDALSKALPDNPFFAPYAGLDEVTANNLVHDALDIQRKAFEALKYTPPPPLLLDLIRRGKLANVGFAIPTPIPETREIGAVEPPEWTGQAYVPRGKGAEAAKPVTSCLDFTRALVSTILPALIAQPRATARWLVLARTVCELNLMHDSWAPAKLYLDRVLNDRVLRAGDYAEIDNATILAAGDMARALAFHPPPYRGTNSTPQDHRDGARMGPGSHAGSMAAAPCGDWNRGICHRGERCRYRHQCASCASPAHTDRQCSGNGAAAASQGHAAPRPPHTPKAVSFKSPSASPSRK